MLKWINACVYINSPFPSHALRLRIKSRSRASFINKDPAFLFLLITGN